jgi:hypothetical protein
VTVALAKSKISESRLLMMSLFDKFRDGIGLGDIGMSLEKT